MTLHKPLHWQALARLRGGGGGVFPVPETSAGFLTQFARRTRNSFIAIVAVLVIVLALAALPAQAQTTVTISGPSTLPEGGLVAQQVGNCPEMQRQTPTKRANETVSAFYTRYIAWYQANRYSRNYCEFRDIPNDTARARTVTVTVRNAQAGMYSILTEAVRDFRIADDVRFATLTGLGTLTAGETKTVSFQVVSIPNYTPGDTSTNAIIVVDSSGDFANPAGRHEITVVDDDNSAYIGQRRMHPYGGSWNSQPHCYGSMNCAYD